VSAEVSSWALDQDIKPAGRKLVLLAIADFTNFTDDGCLDHIPRVEALTAWTSLSPKEVERHLRALVRAGIVRFDPNGGRE
jgi:DNA-binding transcriptional ArsR family regulator